MFWKIVVAQRHLVATQTCHRALPVRRAFPALTTFLTHASKVTCIQMLSNQADSVL